MANVRTFANAKIRLMTGGQVQLVDLVKRFAEVTAVDGINVEVAGGEFFSLLGPSGCGKTTTLRLIAGFEQPTEGTILLDGRDVAHTPPHKRNVNTVFQSYALFPFLTVEENVSFGLRYQNVTKGEARQKAAEALALVRLEGLQKRRPRQLSGGQQQRVALARALVLNPAVLLLDEPLGALDAKLRKALQIELKALQEEVGVTFIYVTHDQEEALTMSDRLAVMSNGRIEQVGTPVDVYEEPSTAYVADFLGVSNMMPALGDGGGRVRLGDFQLMAASGEFGARGRIRVVIRPERVHLEDHGTSGGNRIPGMVERVLYVGATIQVVVHLAHGETLQAWMQNRGGDPPWQQGTPVSVHLPAGAIRVLADETDAGGAEAPVATGDSDRSSGWRAGAAVKDQDTLGTGAS
jgi:spermidine/putrescine transport system ATP-binding protein